MKRYLHMKWNENVSIVTFSSLIAIILLASFGQIVEADTTTWSNTASMSYTRSHFATVQLGNGNILVIGGNGSGANTSEIYNPTTGTWGNTAILKYSAANCEAVLLPNGKVLSMGGTGIYSKNCQIYDSSTNSWSSADSMITGRSSSFEVTLLPNGKVLVTGGSDPATSNSTAKAEIYNPSTNSWSSAAIMPTALRDHTATLLNNGKVLVAGGYGTSYLNSAILYDYVGNSWSTTGSMLSTRKLATATLLSSGKVLVVGGYNSSTLNSADLYDPTTGTWSSAGSMPNARRSHTSTLLSNGKVFIAGGGADSTILNSSDIYEPTTNTWSSGVGSMLNTRSGHILKLLNNGKVLVAGGFVSNSNITSIKTAELCTIAVTSTLIPTPVITKLETINQTQAQVTWNKIPNITVYNVETSTNNFTTVAFQGDLTRNTADDVYTATIITSGSGTLSVRIRAKSGEIYGPVSNIMSIAMISKPAAPILNTPTVVNSNQINLSWNVVTGATNYKIYRNSSYLTAVNATSYSDTGLLASTSYSYYVKASNNIGDSGQSNTVSATTQAISVQTGSIIISNGSSTTENLTVSLTISAIGATQMKVSINGSFAGADWETYASSKNINLTSGIGIKSVFVKFKDAQGNESSTYSDTILLINNQVADFIDVPKSHWAYNYIMDMASRRILEGNGDRTFNPDGAVTREQFAKILTLSLALPHTEKPATPTFVDVPNNSDTWAYEYVEAVKNYLTRYRKDDRLYFRPKDNAVREDMIVAIVLAKNLGSQTPNLSVLDRFSDNNQISPSLRNYMAIAVSNGIAEGDAGYLMPQGTLTRAEACALIYKSSFGTGGEGEKVIISYNNQ